MPRKGYKQEYQARLMLEKIHGKGNVIKTSSSQNIPDYVIFGKFVAFEIKSTVDRWLCLKKRDREQWWAFKKWMEETDAQVFYWVIFRKRPRNIINKYTHEGFGRKYIMKCRACAKHGKCPMEKDSVWCCEWEAST